MKIILDLNGKKKGGGEERRDVDGGELTGSIAEWAGWVNG